MSKKLTLTQIKKEANKYSTKERVPLDNDTHVYIYPNFSPLKIQEMITELMSDQTRAEEEGLTLTVNFTDWGFFNIIKHFADLDIPNEIDKKITVYNDLIQTEYYSKILQSFPIESIKKVGDMISKTTEALNSFNDMNEEDRKKFIETFLQKELAEVNDKNDE